MASPQPTRSTPTTVPTAGDTPVSVNLGSVPGELIRHLHYRCYCFHICNSIYSRLMHQIYPVNHAANNSPSNGGFLTSLSSFMKEVVHEGQVLINQTGQELSSLFSKEDQEGKDIEER